MRWMLWLLYQPVRLLACSASPAPFTGLMWLALIQAYMLAITSVVVACLPGLSAPERAAALVAAAACFSPVTVLLATYDAPKRASDVAALWERHTKALQLLENSLPSIRSLAEHVALKLLDAKDLIAD